MTTMLNTEETQESVFKQNENVDQIQATLVEIY